MIYTALVAFGAAAAAVSSPVLRHWAVSTEDAETDFPRVVFTLIGSADSPKLPILVLSYRNKSWNALLTCGERLEEPAANLSITADGENEPVMWRMTRDHGGAFAPEAERFVMRLLNCRKLEVEFPAAGQHRRAAFDTTGLEKEIDNFPEAKKALVPDKVKQKAPSATVLGITV